MTRERDIDFTGLVDNFQLWCAPLSGGNHGFKIVAITPSTWVSVECGPFQTQETLDILLKHIRMTLWDYEHGRA